MLRFRKAIAKARTPRQTMNDLQAYLNDTGDKSARWLARKVQEWGEFSYSELASAIEDGRLDDLLDWQSLYAEIVNEHFAPLWASAMAAAALKATGGKVVLSDSDEAVQTWIRARGGELISGLSEESRRAVMNIILRGQALAEDPRRLAQEIRPLIGLNQRQAQANVTYRERVYQRFIERGLSPSKAAEKSDAAALRYAGKQHRYRAETIVNTEMAFAYNRGAHMGVGQAIANGYMGKCEMVWTTAGTNRVCSRCMELRGRVVGTTEDSGVTIPPLHPRCRCTIMYQEVEPAKALRPNKPQVEFTPAKNIKEADNFATTVLGVPKASYKGCDVAVANEWNKALTDTFNRFSEIKDNFGFVGTIQERNAALKAVIVDHYLKDLVQRYPNETLTRLKGYARRWAAKEIKHLEPGFETVAVSWSPTTEITKAFRGVTVNKNLAANIETLNAMHADAVAKKWSPVGCTTVKSSVDHEIGHQLDDLLGLRDLPEVQALFDSRVVMVNGKENFDKITEDLSKYAWDNTNPNRYSEFIAEAWSEYCNNPNPREIAKQIGKIVEREYSKKFLH